VHIGQSNETSLVLILTQQQIKFNIKMHCVAHVLFSAINLSCIRSSALTVLAGRHEGHPDGKSLLEKSP